MNQGALIRQRRAQAAREALKIAADLGLDQQETERFLSSAVSNAIWDVQEGAPYRSPVYKPPAPVYTGPVYTEMSILPSTKK